jgi:DNA polymerase
MGSKQQRLLAEIAEEVRRCTACRLHEQAQHGVPGDGAVDADIFFVGQAPGANEDKSGKPFIGRAGQFLNELLAEIKIARESVFVTGMCKHFPPKNRAPRQDEIDACKPFVVRQIEAVNPRIVVLLGKTAESLLGHPVLDGRTVLVTVHPAAGMRFPKMKDRMRQDFQRLRKMVAQLKNSD